MALTFLKTRYNVKPPVGAAINYGHPLAQNLLYAWVFNEGGGPPREAVKNIRPTLTGSGFSWIAHRAGDFSGANYWNYGNRKELDGLSAFTVAARLRVDSWPLGFSGVLSKRASFATNDSWSMFQPNSNFSANSIGVNVGDAAGVHYSFDMGPWSGFKTLFCIYDNTLPPALRFLMWFDNMPVPASAILDAGGVVVPAGPAPLVVGAYNTDAPLFFDGACEFIYVWGKRLTEIQRRLLVEPYCFFHRSPRHLTEAVAGPPPSSRTGDHHHILGMS